MDTRDGCPCKHTTPCITEGTGCTCVNGFSSYGCLRCCKYGSAEQQKSKAELLASLQSPELMQFLQQFHELQENKDGATIEKCKEAYEKLIAVRPTKQPTLRISSQQKP